MKIAPKSLKYWFLIHFMIDYLFGIPLLINPEWFLKLFGWTIIDNFSARLVGAALIGIGGISFLKHKSNLEVYNTLLNLKILWSFAALIGIFLSMIYGAPKFGWLVFVIFLFFFLLWNYYKRRLKQ